MPPSIRWAACVSYQFSMGFLAAYSRKLLVAPGFGWLLFFMGIPCGVVFYNSFFERGVYGGIDYVFTLDNFQRTLDPLYLNVFLNSAKIAGTATLAATLIAYPAAYLINRAPRRHQTALLFLAILPFWSNYLIRTYAWIVLLNNQGVVHKALVGAHLIDEPVKLLYSEFAVITGLVYNYLPFVILAIYSSLNRLNPEIMEASSDLGAPPWRTFLRVILPLTIPGVTAGAVFVFVLSIGNFITPDLLGGGHIQMVGNLIYDQFLSARDWPFGAALSLMLIAIMLVLLFIHAVIGNRAQGERAGAAQ